MMSTRVIGKSSTTPEEIEIIYKGNKVNRVIRTIVILWNSGNKTIFGSNIVEKDPLRIEVSPDEEIIAYNIVKKTNDVNEITLEKNGKNSLNIKFNYLDANDGATIEIFHTDDELFPDIKGTIIGLPNGAIINKNGIDISTMPEVYRRLFSKKMHFITSFFGFIGILLFIFSRIPKYREFTDSLLLLGNSLETLYYVVLVLGIIYTFIPMLLLFLSSRKHPKELSLRE
jgi:hypothetical protein